MTPLPDTADSGPFEPPSCVDAGLPHGWAAGRDLFIAGDAHLHAHSPAGLVEDLVRTVRGWTAARSSAVLVFNGDLFDLDRVAGEPRAGVGETRAAARLASILDAWPLFTAALREHVAAGGLLFFVAGNHDAELLLPVVGSILRDRLAPRNGPKGPAVLIGEALSLPGAVIRHGHQLDPDSAFAPDTPTALSEFSLAAFPLASLMTRLLLSWIPRFELLSHHRRVPVRVLLRVIRDHRVHALPMIARYPLAAVRIVALSASARLFRGRPLHPDAFTMSSPWTVVRRLYLDRYLATLCLVPVAITAASGWLGRWPWLALAVLASSLIVPPRRRRHFDDRDARSCEREAGKMISDGAHLVVFGHTHQAFAQSVGRGVFANHGAFSEAADPPGVHDAADTPPIRTGLPRTYLEVRGHDLRCQLRVTLAAR